MSDDMSRALYVFRAQSGYSDEATRTVILWISGSSNCFVVVYYCFKLLDSTVFLGSGSLDERCNCGPHGPRFIFHMDHMFCVSGA